MGPAVEEADLVLRITDEARQDPVEPLKFSIPVVLGQRAALRS
jgi:hypothetical protein